MGGPRQLNNAEKHMILTSSLNYLHYALVLVHYLVMHKCMLPSFEFVL